VLNWLKRFDTFCFLDNHSYRYEPHSVECLVAAGIRGAASQGWEGLSQFLRERQGSWLFGHLNYELKDRIHSLSSKRSDRVGFPELFFFEPQILLEIGEDSMRICASDPSAVFREIEASVSMLPESPAIRFQPRISRGEYLSIIRRLKEHIHRGDCYEINFCQEFFAENVQIDPAATYRKLSAVSPNPFSALYRVGHCWLICASPERFLKKEGERIVSQPVKGTAKRSAVAEEDIVRKKRLRESQKEQAENVMVVDLVRNDFSRVCEEGSVRVDELYGIYSFPQVHQMISTVSGMVRKGIDMRDIISACFPMGSMTGAPKRRVMQLIEEYEKTARGIFSGALGYISPQGDFDLNVVIRSIMYNEKSGYLSFQAGSGITHYSDPELEWEECMLKAQAIRKVFGEE